MRAFEEEGKVLNKQNIHGGGDKHETKGEIGLER